MAAAPLLIVGGGHAAGRAAGALRDAGYGESIYLIGDETLPPYERPPLSKEVLTKNVDPMAATIYPEKFYEKNSIRLFLGSPVSGLDLKSRTVVVGQSKFSYSRLLFCTGSRPRLLEAGGEGVKDVLYLRSAADALALRSRLEVGSRIVLVGGGYIGLEVASSAVARGCSVTVLEAGPQILGRGISAEIAAVVGAVHRCHGVTIRTSVKIERIIRSRVGLLLECSDGSRYPADLVVAGIGAVPNIEVCSAAGISCGNGILTDEFGRTEAPNVYAAGDVACRNSPRAGRHIRLESWENAEVQAAIIAQNLLDARISCDSIPWFWTDQYDLNLQVLGIRDKWDEIVVRGDVDNGSGSIFYLRDKKIVSAELLNSGRDRRAVKSLMEHGIPVDRKKIESKDIPIAKTGVMPTASSSVPQAVVN